MTKTIIKAPSVTMTSLSDLFIEMTAQNCNLRCKHCYIDFNDKKVKDFISVDKIKQALCSINKKELNFIHLTGAEPTMHPDFNFILRLCLKYSSVIIHTNALNINDKKARFLRKVEEENNLGHEIIFMISIDHYVEKENDALRGRGSFRKAIHAVQSLIKYDFNPILCIVNHFNENEEVLINKFSNLCLSFGFKTSDINFKILPLFDKNSCFDIPSDLNFSQLKMDCMLSRTLTKNGVFSCPLLCSDNRGKCGSDFTDFSSKNYLETSFCAQCIKYNRYIFTFQI